MGTATVMTAACAIVSVIGCYTQPSPTTVKRTDPTAPAAPASGPGCSKLPRTCGASGAGDCCESPLIAGGVYFRSYDRASDWQSGTQDAPATISDFRLDKYEVSVGRFRVFVEAGGGTQDKAPVRGAGGHPRLDGSGWNPQWDKYLARDRSDLVSCPHQGNTQRSPTWSEEPGPRDNLPINCVSWFEAMAFCAWDGGYLPTEAEWNYAAAGGNEQRAYPWSQPPGALVADGARALYEVCAPDGSCDVPTLVGVGSLPDGNGRWGHADLAGGLSEWALDSERPYTTPCADCAALGDADPMDNRVTRGGSHTYSARQLRTGARGWSHPAAGQFLGIGFRCARPAVGAAPLRSPPADEMIVQSGVASKKINVRDIVQPVTIEKQELAEIGDDPDGVEGGDEGGQVSPPPPPPPLRNIAQRVLEEQRIAGNKVIVPDDVTKTEIQRSGKNKIVGSYKLCLDAGGRVTVVNQLKSTGFTAYDAKILREMRGWQYRPYLVNAKAVPVCAAVTFIYP